MKLPRDPDELESLGMYDCADEFRTHKSLRENDINRLELERHYEWLAKQKAKNKKYRKTK